MKEDFISDKRRVSYLAATYNRIYRRQSVLLLSLFAVDIFSGSEMQVTVFFFYFICYSFSIQIIRIALLCFDCKNFFQKFDKNVST